MSRTGTLKASSDNCDTAEIFIPQARDQGTLTAKGELNLINPVLPRAPKLPAGPAPTGRLPSSEQAGCPNWVRPVLVSE